MSKDTLSYFYSSDETVDQFTIELNPRAIAIEEGRMGQMIDDLVLQSRTLWEADATVRVLNPCFLGLAQPVVGIALLKQIAQRVADRAVFLQPVALCLNF
ncbi:MAG: hypothetical protein V7K90_24255 [Nostoc sp.]|uniref:hypothetical protein n=1 Tax=Nostoc sp. TaxID=1180 RepID=UPI002FF77F27